MTTILLIPKDSTSTFGRLLCSVVCRFVSKRLESTSYTGEVMARKRKCDPVHVQLKKRYKESNMCLTPANISLHVLSSGCEGYGKCLLLQTSFTRYLFNCPENTTRLGVTSGLKIARVEHMFCTHASWHNLGGLMGLGYVLREAGSVELHVHGPTNLELIYDTNRSLNGYEPPVRMLTHEYDKETVFEDDAFVITTVPLFRPSARGGTAAECAGDAGVDEQRLAAVVAGGSESGSRPASPTSQSSHHRAAADSPLSDSDGGDSDSNPLVNPTSLEENGIESILQSGRATRDVAIAYACIPKSRPGKISIDKCIELKIPIGPMIGELQRGMTVILPDGRTITPDQIQTPPTRSLGFLVVECPSADYVAPLVADPQIEDFRTGASRDLIAVIVHFSPAAVVSTPAYQEWMTGFAGHVDHLFLNDSNLALPHSVEVFAQQVRLNLIHPSIFTLPPVYDLAMRITNDGTERLKTAPIIEMEDEQESDLSELNQPPPHSDDDSASVGALDNVGQRIQPEPFLEYSIRPLKRVITAKCFQYNIENKLEIVRNLPSYPKLLERLEVLKKHPAYAAVAAKREYPEVLFLGTASAAPSKTRNVSGIWINVADEKSILLDCGEGTTSQVFSYFSKPEAEKMLTRLKGVCISHLHADHMSGLCTLMLRRQQAFKNVNLPYEKLFVLAPSPLFRNHNVFSLVMEDVRHLALRVVSRASNPKSEIRRSKLLELMVKACGLQSITPVKVFHPMLAYGFVLRTAGSPSRKLVYSGDTLPCEPLIDAGKYADLLIHEASMDDSMPGDAYKKRHCTMSQAVQVAECMQAKHAVLTHFSARYSRIPLLPDRIGKSKTRISIAFDFMRFDMSQLEILSELMPLQKLVFADYYFQNQSTSQLKQLKRQMREEQHPAFTSQNGSLAANLSSRD